MHLKLSMYPWSMLLLASQIVFSSTQAGRVSVVSQVLHDGVCHFVRPQLFTQSSEPRRLVFGDAIHGHLTPGHLWRWDGSMDAAGHWTPRGTLRNQYARVICASVRERWNEFREIIISTQWTVFEAPEWNAKNRQRWTHLTLTSTLFQPDERWGWVCDKIFGA